jgi:hypothetical protein
MNNKLNNMPGFTAEASLYETSGNYRMGRTFVSVNRTVSIAGIVIPQRGAGGGDCPQGPGCQCDYPGFKTCWDFDCNTTTTGTIPCDTFAPATFHCYGGTCTCS